MTTDPQTSFPQSGLVLEKIPFPWAGRIAPKHARALPIMSQNRIQIPSIIKKATMKFAISPPQTNLRPSNFTHIHFILCQYPPQLRNHQKKRHFQRFSWISPPIQLQMHFSFILIRPLYTYLYIRKRNDSILLPTPQNIASKRKHTRVLHLRQVLAELSWAFRGGPPESGVRGAPSPHSRVIQIAYLRWAGGRNKYSTVRTVRTVLYLTVATVL